MTTWTQTVVGTRSDHDLSRLVGRLSDGIVFVKLANAKKEELKDLLTLKESESNRYQLLLLIRSDLYDATTQKLWKSNFYSLHKKISTYIRICVDSDAFIAKTSNPRLSEIELNDTFRVNNIYSNKWPKLLSIYEDYKTTFDLFSAATVTDRVDVIFNVLNSVISLESLLLNGESAENAYKFRMRGTYMLSKDSRQRKLIYDFLKLVYDLRSSVVHSNDKLRRKTRDKIKSEYGLTLYEVNYELIKMNRYIFKQFIDDPSILQKFDEIVISGKVPSDVYKSDFIRNRVKTRQATISNIKKMQDTKVIKT